MFIKDNLLLIGLCVLILTFFTVTSWAFAGSNAPDVHGHQQLNAKNGDMFVLWYGTSTVGRTSARMESVGSRGLGGGVHGGK